jgi:hypothetical protein
MAWRQIESPKDDPVPYYEMVVELPDGRKFRVQAVVDINQPEPRPIDGWLSAFQFRGTWQRIGLVSSV